MRSPQWLCLIFICLVGSGAFGREPVTARELRAELSSWRSRLLAREAAGRAMPCSRQIYTEASWYIGYAVNLPAASRRLQDLRRSFGSPQAFALEQSPIDGAWGACFENAFFKLDTSIDFVVDLAEHGKVPTYPLRFLEAFNTPERLVSYLNARLISDTTHDHRKELNYAVSALMRFIGWGLPTNFVYHPELRSTLEKYLAGWQDPRTGFWGAWYIDERGQIVKTSDLSMTFHFAAYQQTPLAYKQELLQTLLAMREARYPFGWREGEWTTTHHLYDVAKLMRLSWDAALPEQRERIARELLSGVRWTLARVLRADGSFAVSSSDDTLGDATYFGVSLLEESGFFQKERRFWRSRNFPEARAVCERIRAHLKARVAEGARNLPEEKALAKLGRCEDAT